MLENREHRTVEIRWSPRTPEEWSIFTKSREDAAKLWNKLIGMHEVARRFNWKWPGYRKLCDWAKGKFQNLNSQTVQQIIKDFCDDVFAVTQRRKSEKEQGLEVKANYPWRMNTYRDVVYTNQMAVFKKGGILKLSNGWGGNGKLRIKMPEGVVLPGRMMEVYLCYGKIRIVCEIPAKQKVENPTPVGIDLGVNTLIAATDGTKAILINGREIKAINQYRSKCLADFWSALAKTKKGSKRHKKLSLAKAKMLDKTKRQIKDIVHKATAAVVREFPVAHAIVGRPFNDAAVKMRAKHAQQVGDHCGRTIIKQLQYKCQKTTEIKEFFTSQTCPGCGCRNKCRRVYHCTRCDLRLPRDVVGCVNNGRIEFSSLKVPTEIIRIRPIRKSMPERLRPSRASSPGTGAHLLAKVRRLLAGRLQETRS